MTRTEIEQIVKKFLIEDFEIEPEKITMEGRMKEDIGIDSLDMVDVAVIVDKKFGFKIQPDEMKNTVTLNDFCNYIEQKIAK